jgi:predicted nucleic acid-binding protein
VADDRPGPELRLLARAAGAMPVLIGPGDELAWGPGDGPLVAVAPPSRRQSGTSEQFGPTGDEMHDHHPVGAERLVGSQVHVVDLAAPDPGQRSAHWALTLRQAGMPQPAVDDLAPTLAGRFGFAEGEIETIVTSAATLARWHGHPLDAGAVWAAARRRPSRVLDRLASLVTPVFTLDDLVLPADTRAQLDELLNHVALQHLVLDQWGFRRRLPRGQGVAAMLAGPPGTGKTTACEALAHALRQDLYVIDLSAVVSKYIGETEQHLAAAFNEAERAGAVLFFDEADSLFGRRTEIKDAHDRYANLEVNFLLQRVETFTGLVLLASNRRSALDDAFLRRLRFVITFALPDAAARRELWRRAFPAEAHVADLDYDRLAGPELTGATIQAAALAAAFTAARGGTPVTQAHVTAALRRQYQKLDKAWAGL